MAYTTQLLIEVAGAQDVKNQFRQMGASMQQVQGSAGKLNQSLGGTSQSLTNTGRAADSAGKGVSNASKGMDTYSKSAIGASQASQNASKATASMGDKVQNAAGGFALAGSAAISLWRSYDNVTDSAKKVEIAENRVNAMELRLSRAREALNKLQQSGTASALDLQQAQQQVSVAEGNVERAAFNLTNAQEALNEAWLDAATSIIPAVFTGISGISSIMNAFKAATATTIPVTTASAASIAEIGATSATSAVPLGAMAGAAQTATAAEVELTAAGTVATGSIAGVAGAAGTAVGPLASFGIGAGDSAVAVGGLTAANTLAEPSLIGVGAGAGVGAAGMDALNVSSKAATVSMAAALLPITLIVAAFGAIVVGAAAVHDNIGGLGDAFGGFVTSLEDATGASQQTRKSIDDMGFSVGDMLDRFIAAIPIVNDFWLSVGGKKPVDFQVHAELASRLKTIQDQETATKTAQDALQKSTEEFNQSLSKLSPMVQQAANYWQLYNNGVAATTQEGQNMLNYLKGLDSALQPVRENTIALARANGVDLWHALNMTDAQMQDFILSSGQLAPTMQQAAEASTKAAQDFADSWMKSFDAISSRMDAWGGTMKSALDTVLDDLGKEIKIGWGDKKMKFAADFGFNEDFWDTFFPQTLARQAFKNNFDIDNLMSDVKSTLKNATRKGLITKEQSKEWFQPLQDFMKNDLPEDSKEAFGFLVGRMPSIMADLKPALINGMVEVGKAAKDGIKTWITDPITHGLDVLQTGESGKNFGRNILGIVKQNMDMIRQQAGPEVAGTFEQVLSDASLTVDQKVQEIIQLLGQVNPAWKDQILAMDKDSDGIADIMDNKILGPVDTMRVGILQAFADIAEASGDMTMFQKLTDKIANIQNATDPATTSLTGFAGELAETKTAASDDLIAKLKSTGDMIGVTGVNAKKTIEPINGMNAALRKLYENPIMGGSKTVTGALGTITATASSKMGVSGGAQGAADLSKGAKGPDTSAAKSAIDDLVKYIQNALTGASATISKWTLTDVPGILSKLDIMTATKTAWDPIIVPITDALTKAAYAVGKWTVTDIPGILARLDIAESINTIFGTGLAPVQLNLGNILSYIQTWLPAVPALMGQMDIASALDTVFSTSLPKVQENLGKVASQVGAWLPSIPALLKQIDITQAFDTIFGGGTLASVNAGLGSIASQVAAWLPALPSLFGQIDITTAISNLFTSIDLTEAKNAVFNAIGTDTGILGTVKGAVQSIIDWASDPSNPLKQAWEALTNIFSFQTANAEEGTAGATAAGIEVPNFQPHIDAWNAYQTSVSDIIDTIGQDYIRLVTGLDLVAQGVNVSLNETAIAAWNNHVESVGGEVDAVGGQLIRLATGYGLLSQAVNNSFSQTIGYWSHHVSAIGGQVNKAGQQLIKLATGYALLMSAGSRAMNNLASAVASAMSKIVNAMSKGISMAHSLQSSIDALHGKDITITTHYRTVGSPGGGLKRAQHGIEPTVFDHPVHILAGEAGPELVSVTPLNKMSNSFGTALTGGMGMLRAAKGANVVAGADKRMLYEGDIRYFLDKHGMKLEQFTDLDKKGKILISAMRRGNRPAISRSEWKDFAHQYGFKLHDIDKKKGGIYEIELSGGKKKLKMNLGRGFAGPGLGLNATGFAPQGGFADRGIAFDTPMGGQVAGFVGGGPTRSSEITRNLSATTGGSVGGGGGGGSDRPIELTVNVTVPLDSEVVGRAASKHVFTNVSGF